MDRRRYTSGMSIAEVIIALVFLGGITITGMKFLDTTQKSQFRDTARLRAQSAAATVTNLVASSSSAHVLTLLARASAPMTKTTDTWIAGFEEAGLVENIRIALSFAGPVQQKASMPTAYRKVAPLPSTGSLGHYDILITTTVTFYRDAKIKTPETLTWTQTLHHDAVELAPSSETCATCGA